MQNNLRRLYKYTRHNFLTLIVNRIIRCKKIHSINIDNINEEEKIRYYYIINIKGYFIMTIKK